MLIVQSRPRPVSDCLTLCRGLGCCIALCVRDLAALSVHPLLVTPTHYTGEPGYISDTEDAGIININTQPSHGEPQQTLNAANINKYFVGANMKEEL